MCGRWVVSTFFHDAELLSHSPIEPIYNCATRRGARSTVFLSGARQFFFSFSLSGNRWYEGERYFDVVRSEHVHKLTLVRERKLKKNIYVSVVQEFLRWLLALGWLFKLMQAWSESPEMLYRRDDSRLTLKIHQSALFWWLIVNNAAII